MLASMYSWRMMVALVLSRRDLSARFFLDSPLCRRVCLASMEVNRSSQSLMGMLGNFFCSWRTNVLTSAVVADGFPSS